MEKALTIISRYYPDDTPLRRLLIAHSEQVCQRALSIVARHPEWHIDADFVAHAAMLHDIGIFRCDAPGIHCHGDAPYILHGVIGAAIMRAENDAATARVCERHTGTGLTREDFSMRGLPQPDTDLLPETLVEEIICYADKFYSKSHVGEERSLDEVLERLSRHGAGQVQKFREWAQRFE